MVPALAWYLERTAANEFGRVQPHPLPEAEEKKKINVAFIVNTGERLSRRDLSELLEIALVLVRLDHVASVIVNANYSIVRADEELTAFLELESAIRASHRFAASHG